MNKKSIERNLYLCRGNEYKVIDFKTNLIRHYKPYLNKKPHEFYCDPLVLIKTSYMCPICDKTSKNYIIKEIDNKLEELKQEKDFDIKRNVKINNLFFDFVIFNKKEKIYIKYFSRYYYTNVTNERNIVKEYSDYIKAHKMKFYKITHLNYLKKINKLSKLVNKYF